MGNTLSYFLRPHMLLLLAAVLAVAFAATWLLRDRLPGRPRRVLCFLLLVSLGLVLGVTLLREAPLGTCLECLTDWRIDRLLDGRITTETLLNVLLFIPPAFLATLLWRHPFRVTTLLVLLSVGIEVLQALVGVGANDLLDVLANAVGALIGSWAGWVAGLVGDAVVAWRLDGGWRFDGREAVKAGALAVGAVAVWWAGTAWGADARQAAAVARLEERFGGTTLADYRRWESEDALDERVYAMGTTWPDESSSDGSTARVRFPVRFFLLERCVIATWDEAGFSTRREAGPICSGELT